MGHGQGDGPWKQDLDSIPLSLLLVVVRVFEVNLNAQVSRAPEETVVQKPPGATYSPGYAMIACGGGRGCP